MTYILIVIMHVYAGSAVSFQEFSSKEHCEFAANIIRSHDVDHGNYSRLFTCVQK